MAKSWRQLKNVQFYAETHDRCEVCGGRDGLDIHHRHGKADEDKYDGESVHEDQNLVVCCLKCHTRFHDAMGQRQSFKVWHRETNAINLNRLCRKWGNSGFHKMCREDIQQAFCDFMFKEPDDA
jgi:5-methylcytosine-specific restriction endonuclease McrA